MNKTLLAYCTLGSMLATPVMADTFFGVYAGAQVWDMQTEGRAVLAGFDGVDFADERQANYFLALEHPVPMVPNIKLARTTLDTQGGTNLVSNIDLTTTDYVFYYELFDNDLISFDFGVGARDIDGDVSAENTSVANSQMTRSVSEWVPMAYARSEIGIPATNWGVYAQVYSQPFGGDNITDYEVALTYSLLDNLALDTKLQLGYRSYTLEVDELKNLYADLDFKGAYLGLELHF